MGGKKALYLFIYRYMRVKANLNHSRQIEFAFDHRIQVMNEFLYTLLHSNIGWFYKRYKQQISMSDLVQKKFQAT